ncbi:hypothetical protein Tco_1347577 [Tanacetum coccineum]
MNVPTSSEVDDACPEHVFQGLNGFLRHSSKEPIFDLCNTIPYHSYALSVRLALAAFLMVANFAVIVAEKLYLATLTHVQLFLIEDMLETLMVSINNALHPVQVVTLDLESEYNCT